MRHGIDSWLEQPSVMATLRMSRRSGQSKLKRWIHLTDRIANFVTWMVTNCCINWHLTVAKYTLPRGLSHPLWRAVRICVRGSPLRPFPRVLLCPRNIPKLRSCMGLVVVWIWASLIIVLLFFGSVGEVVACWVWASNRSANFATCPATCCYKNPELSGWDPPRPPRISITDFNTWCHLT